MNNDGGLYIDRLLQQGPQKIELFEESTMFKVPDGRGTSSSLPEKQQADDDDE